METLVPQIHSVELPPIACASDVVGSMFENVGASEASAGISRTTRPLSSMKIRRLARGVLMFSELISPRLELLIEEPGPRDRDDRTKSPLLSLRRSGRTDCWRGASDPLTELEAYRIGDDSNGLVSIEHIRDRRDSAYLQEDQSAGSC